MAGRGGGSGGRFLPQNVSEVGEEKKRLRDPKVQIVTVAHYCDLKMVVSRACVVLVCVVPKYNRI
jgi:hypothetical protein